VADPAVRGTRPSRAVKPEHGGCPDEQARIESTVQFSPAYARSLPTAVCDPLPSRAAESQWKPDLSQIRPLSWCLPAFSACGCCGRDAATGNTSLCHHTLSYAYL